MPSVASHFALVASSFLLVHGASAEQVHLDASAIKLALPGSLLKIDTPLGIVVPIKFGNDGMMSGEAGQLSSVLGSQKDRGRWWTANDQVCFKWFRWFDAQAHCLSVSREGKKVFWKREDGEIGTATLEEPRTPPTHIASTVVVKPVRLENPTLSVGPQALRTEKANSDKKPSRVPVLVKLPTLASRPHKPAIQTAVATPSASWPERLWEPAGSN